MTGTDWVKGKTGPPPARIRGAPGSRVVDENVNSTTMLVFACPAMLSGLRVRDGVEMGGWLDVHSVASRVYICMHSCKPVYATIRAIQIQAIQIQAIRAISQQARRHGGTAGRGSASRSAAAGAARRWSMDLMVRSDFELFPLSCALFLPLTDGQKAVRLVFVGFAPKR